MRIGIDIMGGDYAPGSTLGGAILARESLPVDTEIVFIGDKDVITRYSEEHHLDISGFSIVHTPDNVWMEDHPLKAFKEKPRAGLFLGQKLLVEGSLDGFCSAGNTGAMLVGAMQIINSIPGIIRPAISASIPNLEGTKSVLLDVGLNPDARPDVLYQYGSIGTIYAHLVHGIAEPAVALLNVGIEESKGNLVTRSTYQLMKECANCNFIGNIEANEMFVSSRADVIVTDGFIGNIMLKQAEAFYKVVSSKGVGNGYFEMFNYENFGGTPVLGVNAPLLIGHGISNDKAIKNMLLHTAEVVGAGLVKRIKEELER
ncbi:MAG: phosphate acyltransferase [Candidatus Atribacteria bacterium]|nr:MAG: phosphate acyltransferase [Candidatus Atribacteria bacterium]